MGVRASLSLSRLFQNHLLCNRIISRNDFLCPITESACFAGAQRSEPRRKNVGLSWPFVCDLWFIAANTHTHTRKKKKRDWIGMVILLLSLTFLQSFLREHVHVCMCVCESPELESLFFWHIFSSSLVSCSIHLASDCYYVWLTESTAKTLGRQKRDTNSSNNNVEQKFSNVWRLNLYLCEVKKKSQ